MSTFNASLAFAAGLTVMPATMVAGGQAAPATSAPLCWRSVAPDTGPQDLNLAFTEPTLTATASGEIWLGWQENDTRLLRRAEGRWTSAPTPTRPGVDGLWVEAVAAAPSGRVVVAAGANREDGASELHIGRMIDGAWEWLGAPLISSQEPFTHAQRPSIAFIGDRPVVAWSEERDANLAGLFVALWNGSSWERLGSLTPATDDSLLSPTVAVDRNGQIWLAWDDAGRRVRVARWDGATWRDVGRETLDKITAAQGATALGGISLAIDTKGHAWVLRVAAKEASGAELALARWEGTGWTAISPPRGAEGKDQTAWSAAMILRNDAPIVAWSQSDATDNHRLYLSQWAPGDRWSARLSGLHLLEGVSNVADVRLAAGNGDKLFVAWDEPGMDKRRTRLVQGYKCAAGENPAPPPKSTVERDTWPTTVDEAARRIVSDLNEESKARVRATSKDQLIQYYSGWGMGIRNSFGLWRGNDKLLESCGRGRRAGAEECSMVIIEAVWTLLQTSKPEAPGR